MIKTIPKTQKVIINDVFTAHQLFQGYKIRRYGAMITSAALPVTLLKVQAMKKVKSSKSYMGSILHFRLE